MDFSCCVDCIYLHEGDCNGNNEDCDWVIDFNKFLEDEKKMAVGKKGDNVFKIGDRVKYFKNGHSIPYGTEFIVTDDYPQCSCKHVTLVDLNGNEHAGIYVGNIVLIYREEEEDKKEFHSSHYESDAIEPIEFMMSNKLDMCRSSIIKYAFRAGKKEGQETLDIKKIIDYALLLAQQENITFTKKDAQDIIDYRFNWKEARK